MPCPPDGRGEGRDIQRLRWRSRRGLLELDLVFDRFWKGPGTRMTPAEAAALERLLLLPDNDLLDLVMGKTTPPGGDLGDMVKILRAA